METITMMETKKRAFGFAFFTSMHSGLTQVVFWLSIAVLLMNLAVLSDDIPTLLRSQLILEQMILDYTLVDNMAPMWFLADVVRWSNIAVAVLIAMVLNKISKPYRRFFIVALVVMVLAVGGNTLATQRVTQAFEKIN